MSRKHEGLSDAILVSKVGLFEIQPLYPHVDSKRDQDDSWRLPFENAEGVEYLFPHLNLGNWLFTIVRRATLKPLP